jgi:hypothetical protein
MIITSVGGRITKSGFLLLSERDKIGKTVASLIVDKDDGTLGWFKNYLKTEGLGPATNLGKLLSALSDLANNTLSRDDHDMVVETLLGYNSSLPELSGECKNRLLEFVKLVTTAKRRECNHSNYVIIPLLHGGGICAPYIKPEYVCMDCGLNVSIHITGWKLGYGNDILPGRKVTNSKTQSRVLYGLEFSDVSNLMEFVKGLGEPGCRTKVLSSNLVVDNYRGVVDKSVKYTGPCIITLVDKGILESRSGI